MIYYVSQNSGAPGDGTQAHPFRQIQPAAELAMPGDTVIIGDGVYREWVNPKHGGLGNNQRITYIAEEGAHPVISGAEIVSHWQRKTGSVWYTVVENSLFGKYHSFTDEVFGDWYDGLGQVHHTGELFLDGDALYESASYEALCRDPEPGKSGYRWFAQVRDTDTVLYGNFGPVDPNAHVTEISVRPYCFFPEKEGINYITVSGLTLCCAATQWAPPTAFQPGLIGPHWSKGWIIENCRIHDSKCCGISLGKRAEQQDNAWTKYHRKGGTQIYTELIFANLSKDWDRETVGSHIVRGNEIYNCGQAGIVGCMGGAFSEITGNHIHHVNIRHEFSGAEMAGIKLHAAVDAVIAKNVIHDCIRGIWLDWEAQGTAVRKNAFFRNEEEDVFIEVSHGPCTVENNLLMSGRGFLNMSQGTAFVHNLVTGKLYPAPDTNRFTLYHLPHSTMVGGVMLVYGGDDRMINNIFVKKEIPDVHYGTFGTACYDGYAAPDDPSAMDHDLPSADAGRTLPVFIHDNVYLEGGQPCAFEENPRLSDIPVQIAITEQDGGYWLETNLYQAPVDFTAARVTTEVLGAAFESGQPYENRDGSPLSVDSDFTDAPRGEAVLIGPFEHPVTRLRLL